MEQFGDKGLFANLNHWYWVVAIIELVIQAQRLIDYRRINVDLLRHEYRFGDGFIA